MNKWRGEWPTTCDICGRSLTLFPTFIDGQTKFGVWGLICPECYRRFGVGLGLGKGQEYETKTLKKIEG